MYLFWLLSILMANGMRHNVALISVEHTQHVAHVKHVKHEDYLAFLTKLEDSRSPIVPPQAPIPSAPVLPSTAPVHTSAPVVPVSAPVGDYSCSALESLWVSVGGNPADEFIAAQIATAESGGNPNAISPTDDYGLWQINASHGAQATLNPTLNAEAAVSISDDGTNWDPWTTYTSGIYASEC
jgi:soluble lytic murein transglycosylase-like protein